MDSKVTPGWFNWTIRMRKIYDQMFDFDCISSCRTVTTNCDCPVLITGTNVGVGIRGFVKKSSPYTVDFIDISRAIGC